MGPLLKWPIRPVLRLRAISLLINSKTATTTIAIEAFLPQWLSGKESTCSATDVRDMGSIPGWGRSPGGGHGNPLQYSCLENPMDKGAC